jgi:PTS system nitrogen regulatory IIA component
MVPLVTEQAFMKLTVEDVSRLFNVSEKTVYRWIKGSELPAYRVNSQYRFNRVDLLEWAAAHRVNVSPTLLESPPETAGMALPSLADALGGGGIHYRVGGHDKASALREIVDLLRLPERIERESLFQILLAREEMGSTGIGDGIAIPHARNPIVMNITQPSVTLCFLETPVDFGALDGVPVQVLFTLITPTIRVHLHLLSRLGFALRAEAFRSAVIAHASREAILAEAQRTEAAFGTGGEPPMTST